MDLKDVFSRWLRRPLLWALVVTAILVWGLYEWWIIPVEVLPRFDYPQVSVVAHEPGATATELENQIVRPLEGELLGLHNLKTVRSTMGNGTVEIDARFERSTQAEPDLMEVNGAIDRVRGKLPPKVQPDAQIMGNSVNEIADYTAEIPANVSPALVQHQVESLIVPALKSVAGVQRVEVYGSGDEALWIQPNLDEMRRDGVSITDIIDAVRSQVLLEPGGYVTRGHQDVLIEARNLPTTIAQIGAIAVHGPHSAIQLRDLARVVRAPLPTHSAVLLDGRPSVALTVFKQSGASTVPVSDAVQKVMASTLTQFPAGVKWVRTYNQGHLVHIVGSDLGRNLVIGGLLAILALFWFLGASRGIWVLAFSIPLSLLIGIGLLKVAGQSLNLLTLGALTVAVGLLADDAIIVLESIYHRWEKGDSRWDGIWRGLSDIVGPDVSGTLTTVSVFLPLLFVGGLAGLFFIPFALAMTFSLLASLVVSLTFLPLVLGFVNARPKAAVVTMAARVLEKLRAVNERLFGLVSSRPILSLVITCCVLVVSLVGLALIPVDFLPLPNEGTLLESFTLPPGSSLSDTKAAVKKMTNILQADPAVSHVFARIGSSSGTAYTEPAYAGEIQITLKPGITVNSLDAIGARVLKETGLTGVQVALDTPTVERLGESLSGLPQPFVIQVFGNRLPELRKVSGELTARLRKDPSFTDIFNNDAYPVTQLDLKPKDDALAAVGMNPRQLYAQFDPLVGGSVISEVPDGNVPLDLYVRLADAPDLSVRRLATIPIRSVGWTPLGSLADLRYVTTPNQIGHLNGARVLDILATPTGPLGGAISSARKIIAGLHIPGDIRISFGGLYPELERAALGIGVAGIGAFVLMTGFLVLQFDGFLVPGLLLLEIPLAIMGGALALLISGVGLNAVALVAFLTLIGIGLNHGIVLLHRVRANERSGMGVDEAVSEAIKVRFRPIFLTTFTAVLGMLPTALGWGEGAAPEQGLAIVILGGVIWSAIRSTNLIPALYLHWRKKQIAKSHR